MHDYWLKNIKDGEGMKGVRLGVPGMREGGKRRLIIPPKLGNGCFPHHCVPLAIDVELVSTKPIVAKERDLFW